MLTLAIHQAGATDRQGRVIQAESRFLLLQQLQHLPQFHRITPIRKPQQQTRMVAVEFGPVIHGPKQSVKLLQPHGIGWVTFESRFHQRQSLVVLAVFQAHVQIRIHPQRPVGLRWRFLILQVAGEAEFFLILEQKVAHHVEENQEKRTADKAG